MKHGYRTQSTHRSLVSIKRDAFMRWIIKHQLGKLACGWIW